MTTPLEGIRVLDLTRVLSGPHCTRMLADLGAEVIKVEPPDGDLTRFSAPRINGLAAYFVQQNAGKRNISLDLSKPGAAEIVLGLARALRRAGRELPAGRHGPPRARLRRRRGAQPADRVRVDHRLRRHRAVGRPPRVRARRRRRDRDDEVAGRRPRRFVRQRSAQPRRRVHVARDVQRDPRRARSAPAFGSWPVDRRVDGADDAVRQRARERRPVGRSDRRRRDP